MSDDGPGTVDRRDVLGALVSVGTATLAGCGLFERGEDERTTAVDDGKAREIAVRFAPTVYFDEAEEWFPTDPRPHESEADGGTVVDGFDALEGYTDRYGDSPPDPTVFYHVVQYEESPLAVVQYWLYSAFDQFSTNFHWHDWEVLHVFVDTDTGDPQLYVASSHSRKVPNNEFLDPETDVPRILSELGSHSSALSVNEERDRFQRLPAGDLFADITNSTIEGVEDIAEIPLAYGLPRDEGTRLPYVVPELENAPIYDHERLPSVEQSDLIDGDHVVRSFDALASPPTDLPERETGVVFAHAERDERADVTYDLVPTAELEGIAEFTGPQLSFEFAVPDFAEDAVASHITTTATPWRSPRYDNPAADISDPVHRATLADRYDAIGEPAPVNTVVASVTNAVTDEQAPEGEGLTTESSTVESVALLESDPEAVPTFGGVAVVRDVPAGEHRLTVNGAGVAPHSETVTVTDDGGPSVAGVEGEIPLVARERARKLEVDPRGADSDLTDLALEDDFAGRLYDAPLSGPDAVYVHEGGAYTTEVRDADDEVGAFRVNPGRGDEDGTGDESETDGDGSDGRIRIDEPRTGKASLASFLVAVTEETRAEIADAAGVDDIEEGGDADGSQTDGGTGDTDQPGGDGGSDGTGQPGGDGQSDGDGASGGGPENAARGLVRALDAVTEAARRALERAEAKDRGQANEALKRVAERLGRVAERLTEARGQGAVPADLSRATERRLDQAQRRAEQAQNAEKL